MHHAWTTRMAWTATDMGILGAPTKMYPAYVSPGPWPNFYSKWSTAALLSDPGFYERMLVRFYHVLLLPFGFVGAILGGFLWRGAGRTAMTVWLISLTIFFFIAGEVHRVHEYYQLPFVVVAAVFFGGAAWPLFDDVWLTRHVGGGRVRLVPYVVIVSLLAITSIYCSSVTQIFFQARDGAERMRQAGRVIDLVTDDNSIAVVVDDYGIMVLYTGTFEAYQGLDLLFAAARHVIEARPDARFVLAGGRPEQIAIAREQAVAAGVADAVLFAGQRPADEIPLFLDAADVLVSPRSTGTNTPLKIYQYLRSGRPIVATRLLTHTQVLNDDVAILTTATAEGFASGILTALTDLERAREVGNGARVLADTKYSYDAYLSRTRQACDHLTAKSTPQVAGGVA